MVGILGGVFASLAAVVSTVVGVISTFGGAIMGVLGIIGRFLPIGKLGKILGIGGLLSLATSAFAGNKGAGIPGTESTTGEPAEKAKHSEFTKGVVNTAAGIGGVVAAGGAIGGVTKAISAGKTTSTAVLNARTMSVGQLANSAPKSIWGKFLKFVAAKSPTLFAKIGLRLAQAGALAAIPVVGWIAAAVQLGFSIWTAWEIYELWKEFTDDGDKEKNGTPTQVSKQEETQKTSFSNLISNANASVNNKLNSLNTPQQETTNVTGRKRGNFGENRGTHIHQGVDWTGKVGDPIYATEEGTVTKAQWEDPLNPKKGYGKYIEIEHGDGSKSRYAHLNNFSVDVGTKVSAGQQIAQMGVTGRTTGAHLHYEKIAASGKKIEPSDNEVKLALSPKTPITSGSTALASNPVSEAKSQLGMSAFKLPDNFGVSQRTTSAKLAQANNDSNKKSGDVVVVTNNGNNNNNGGGKSPAPTQTAGSPAQPYDTEFYRNLMKPMTL
jgi:murein DD-endopeptidase MepM/ murein hydrolase activator NlpD